MEKLYQYVPQELVSFVFVTLFSLLIGLSIRRLNLKREGETTLFGTDRTFTFIGILGYLLYTLDPVDMRLFQGGGLVLGVLLAINYYVKQLSFHVFGVTTIIIALITYCLAPIVSTQPSWFYVTVVVTVLLFTEMKHTFTELVQRMQNDEMLTLAKFLAISGIILPMLPNESLIPGINLTPYAIWLTTVVVSGISYLSYLLKRYVFHQSGILVSGILGGLYSSTATITILARKCKKAPAAEVPEYVAAMLLAVSMMYLRFLMLIFIFSQAIFAVVYPYLLGLSALTAAIAWVIHRRLQAKGALEHIEEEDTENNPLEFKVALIFAGLFVLFTVVTHYTLYYLGTTGLSVLSFVAGLSDITPFILNLLQETDTVAAPTIAACTLQAIVSNISVNLCYALFFSQRRREMIPHLLRGFGLVILANVLLLILFYVAS
ncbi:MAG: MgtC/SapB family protein [Bacteroidaceae bacterium]